MSISSITGLSSTSAASSITFKPNYSTDSTTSTSDSDKTSMSKMGEMMSKLADLEKTDPAKAKQVLTQIASKLNDAAGSATGDDATHLKDLASKFTAAASSGDLSGLQPPKGGHPPGPPPGSDSSSDSSSSTSQTQKYKHHGHKHDNSQVESIMASALSSVDGTDSTDDVAAAA